MLYLAPGRLAPVGDRFRFPGAKLRGYHADSRMLGTIIEHLAHAAHRVSDIEAACPLHSPPAGRGCLCDLDGGAAPGAKDFAGIDLVEHPVELCFVLGARDAISATDHLDRSPRHGGKRRDSAVRETRPAFEQCVEAFTESGHGCVSFPFNVKQCLSVWALSLIHVSEPTRQAEISYAVFCL